MNNQEPTRECCEKCRAYARTNEDLTSYVVPTCIDKQCPFCHSIKPPKELCEKCMRGEATCPDCSIKPPVEKCEHSIGKPICKKHFELSPELSWESEFDKLKISSMASEEEARKMVKAFIKKVEQQAVQQYAKEMFYKMKDFEKVHFNSGRASMVEIIEKICERHINWKATEGYGSEEELGFQKGLVAEAKLLSSDILQALKNKENE